MEQEGQTRPKIRIKAEVFKTLSAQLRRLSSSIAVEELGHISA
jgi:hypothetical protein